MRRRVDFAGYGLSVPFCFDLPVKRLPGGPCCMPASAKAEARIHPEAVTARAKLQESQVQETVCLVVSSTVLPFFLDDLRK
jgi:hypothetical protein